jgi:AmmeMemoRadiSam system protein A
MTSEADRQALLDLARQAIAAHVAGTPSPAIPAGGAAARPGGAFVTLHKHGDLRGCIGHVEANQSLGVTVARCAIAACSADPRFPSVGARELDEIDLELSLLGPLEPVVAPDEIEVGRHGLVIEKGWHRGLLLPQVATEWGWDREAFLAHTCQKAGLPPDAWRQGAKLWKFEAEVFGEPKGH